MKRISLILAGALCLASCGIDGNESEKFTLHYDRPAEFFEEALPIGNGKLGAMIYGGTLDERISLNDITLWTGEPDKGGEHPDFGRIEALTPWGEASEWMDDVRLALEEEDYARADQLQRKIQGHFSENYQPLGTLEICHSAGEISGYRRTLDISKAVATVSYLKDGKAFKAEYFA